MLYAVKAHYAAYYSKAVVYQNMGKIRASIKNFENALVCDQSCEASYYQLENLKRVEEANELDKKAKAEIEQGELAQIKKQQEKKDREKAAKEGRKLAKKARGPGYVVGVRSS